MAKRNDSLVSVEGPDRVHYETGILLNADDFLAEQNYHRGRLARALAYANGSGTLAGLKVLHEPEVPATETDVGRAERILIEPGLAIDRLGRLIEVAHSLCLRINHWYEQQDDKQLRQSWNAADALWSGAPSGVVVDVFIRFAACERGRTPSFATGPFDSIDAVAAARLRDGYHTELLLRQEASPGVPQNPWPDFAGSAETDRPGLLREAIFSAWRETTQDSNISGLDPLPEHAAGQDTTSLFLARMIIPADEAGAGAKPARRVTEPVEIRNDLRSFVITGNALARMLGNVI
ncbi:MAG: hypothetical protein HKN34_12305 [Gammaproteobacteria bacterium]|nr:hypothetical protein [Gammaproteobacteria bacterium]